MTSYYDLKTRRCWRRRPGRSCCALRGFGRTLRWCPRTYPIRPIRAPGQGDPADRRDRPADPVRRRGDADQGAGPQPGGGQAIVRDRCEAAVPGGAGRGRQAGRGGPDDRVARAPGRTRCRRGKAAAGQRARGAAPCAGQGGPASRGRAQGRRGGTAAGPAAPRGQGPGRAAGSNPPDRGAGAAAARGHHAGRGDPAGQPARAGRQADR
jgi:hypothetical protein